MGTSPGTQTLLSGAETLILPARGAHAGTPVPVPKRIGRYEVRTLLGEGSMGRVYRAFDPEGRREVAIKVLKAPFATDARARRRFWREAELATRFRHPAFVAVYEVAENHIVLELVKDRSSKDPLVPWHGDGPGIMKNLFAELRKRGVYTFGKFNCVMVAPPLTAKKEEVDEGLAALDDALTAFETAL